MDLTLLSNATLTNINTRIEHHGEDKVTAIDIDLRIDDLPATELDELALDGNHYSTALWDYDITNGLGESTSPRFPLLKGFAVDVKLENHKATISIESADKLPVKSRGTITMQPAVIKKIKFTPQNNGLASVTLQVQGEVTGPELAKMAMQYLQERVQLGIEPMQKSLLDAAEADQAA